MTSALIALLAGGLLLYLGGEWLVSGSAGLARTLKIPPLLIGLTVVAFGTSMPEVVVSAQAALAGRGAIALGNVIGSNIANLGLILGITALVQPPLVQGTMVRREVPMLLATAAAVPLVLLDGDVVLWEGATLVAAAFVYTAWMVRAARGPRGLAEARAAATVTEEAANIGGGTEGEKSPARLVVAGLAGLAALVAGGHVFVGGATSFALQAGMSERVVGLTIVAVGTSVPELATSLIAAIRGHADIAVGNIVGSNIFNVTICLGAASLMGPVAAPLQAIRMDAVALGTLTAFAAVAMRTERKVSRVEGGLLVAGYIAFLAALARST